MSRTRPNQTGRKRAEAKKPLHPGAAKLSETAAEKVGERADEIVNSLIDSTKKGNATSASILVSLADGADWTDNADTTQRILTLADLLESEPEWPGDVPES